eukprot:402095_1
MMLFETITVILLIINSTFAFTDYSSCKWFGNTTNVPLFPIDVCSAHSHETELDGLTLYSTRMECTDNGELNQYEWDNTDCADLPYHTQTYRKEDGYYFNCDAKTSCPFAKIILWDLSDFGPTGNTSGHNDHICAYDKQKYHEISIVTNICIDLMEEFNVSFYIDCSAHHVSYEEFNDINCKTKIPGNDNFTITEGCDDPFDLNAYVQIAECDDANVNPIITPLPTATIRTTMPTISAMTTATPSKTRTTTMQSKIPTKSPTVSVSPSMSRNDSKSDSSTSNVTWIAIVVSLCVVVMILVVLLIFIVCRQKRLKSEVLLNENMSSINVTS